MRNRKLNSELGHSDFWNFFIIFCFMYTLFLFVQEGKELDKTEKDLAAAQARITELEEKLDEDKRQVQKLEDDNWEIGVQLSFCQSGKDF